MTTDMKIYIQRRVLLKKLIAATLSAAMLLMTAATSVYAEGEDYSDGDYWNNLCTGDAVISADQKTQCSAYIQYISNQSADLKTQLTKIESQRAEIADNIAEYAVKIQDYQAQADELNDDIALSMERYLLQKHRFLRYSPRWMRHRQKLILLKVKSK